MAGVTADVQHSHSKTKRGSVVLKQVFERDIAVKLPNQVSPVESQERPYLKFYK